MPKFGLHAPKSPNPIPNRRRQKIVFLLIAAVIATVAIVSVILALRWQPGPVTTFDLQVGQQLNVAEPGVLDAGKKVFRNDKRLYAVVVYPDAPYVELNRRARVYVTEQGRQAILQEYPIAEHAGRIAEEVPLNNADWPAGAYTVYFERDGVVLRQVQVELSGQRDH